MKSSGLDTVRPSMPFYLVVIIFFCLRYKFYHSIAMEAQRSLRFLLNYCFSRSKRTLICLVRFRRRLFLNQPLLQSEDRFKYDPWCMLWSIQDSSQLCQLEKLLASNFMLRSSHTTSIPASIAMKAWIPLPDDIVIFSLLDTFINFVSQYYGAFIFADECNLIILLISSFVSKLTEPLYYSNLMTKTFYYQSDSTGWVKSCFTVVKIEYLLRRSTKWAALFFVWKSSIDCTKKCCLRSGQISFCIEDAALSRNATRFTSCVVLHTQLNSTWGSNCYHPNFFWWIEMMETEYKSSSNSFDLNDTSREANLDWIDHRSVDAKNSLTELFESLIICTVAHLIAIQDRVTDSTA